MRVDVYLNFRGNCRDAFRFYEEHLGGKLTSIMLHSDSPQGASLPPEFRDKVLHARLELGGMTVMGADIPNAEPMRSAYLTMRVDSAEEAEKLYALMIDGGEVFMKMEKTFFANRFAMFRDRFGTSWMLLNE